MIPATDNPVKMLESASASSGLLATNARLVLLSFFVVVAIFVQRQILRLMTLARQLNC
ncbi:MAG TPA: hypothetical protein VJN21_10010 [Candidatus Acidoferrales bacterium]|nr:hypothetical protein [Candidatus Acidoferrales bacterium]